MPFVGGIVCFAESELSPSRLCRQHSPFDWSDECALGFITYAIADDVDFKCNIGDDLECMMVMNMGLRCRIGCMRFEDSVVVMV